MAAVPSVGPKRLVLLLTVLCLLGGAWRAAEARAGIILVNLSVQGAAVVGSAGGGCSHWENRDDRVTVDCGQLRPYGVRGSQQPPMILDALARPDGQWQIVSWVGCDFVSTDLKQCFIVDRGVDTTYGVDVKVTVDDSKLPTVTLGDPVFSTETDRTVSWPLAADEPATFECSIDGAPFDTCTDETAFTLPEGPHTLRARATDRSGNVGPDVQQAFNIIDTELESSPPDFHASRTATFAFSTLAGFSFDCALDNEPLADCGDKVGDSLTKTYTNLADGAHTFRVRARSGGDVDHVPEVRTWTVDTVRPNTSLDPITGPPHGALITLQSASFAFAATEPAAFQCRLDAQPFAACVSPKGYAGLPFGAHTFQVRGIDRAGNVDLTPAVRAWTIAAGDGDGDGFNRISDCNDANPLVHPGGNEVANNGVDEDCDGADLVRLPGPPQRLDPNLAYSFKAFRRYTRLTRFRLKQVPAGSTVRVTCKVKKKGGKKKGRKAGRCPKRARKRFVRRNASGTVNLRKYTRVRFRPGTRITVRITKPGAIGSVKIYTIRKRKAPRLTERCLPPGTRRPVAC